MTASDRPAAPAVDALLEAARAVDSGGCDPSAAQPRIRYPLGSGEGEVLAMRAGLKPAVRQLLDADAATATVARFESLGCASATTTPTDTLNTRRDQRVVVAAPTRATVDALLALEDRQRELAAHEVLDDAQTAAMREAVATEGRLLGYPPCCVDAFALQATNLGAGSFPVMARALARTRGALRPRLNGLDPQVFHFVPWLVCRFDCHASAAYADRLAALLERRCAGFVRRIDYALAAHRLVFAPQVQVSFTGRHDGPALVVERAWPTSRDRHARHAPRPAEAEIGARLAALLERRGHVSVSNGVLQLAGAPLDWPRRVWLFPFGEAPSQLAPTYGGR